MIKTLVKLSKPGLHRVLICLQAKKCTYVYLYLSIYLSLSIYIYLYLSLSLSLYIYTYIKGCLDASRQDGSLLRLQAGPRGDRPHAPGRQGASVFSGPR